MMLVELSIFNLLSTVHHAATKEPVLATLPTKIQNRVYPQGVHLLHTNHHDATQDIQ